jgi:uncharacterized protein
MATTRTPGDEPPKTGDAGPSITTTSPPPLEDISGEHAVRPRRPMAAGHVIVVGLIALLVGALLNAAGMRKTALSQPVGIRRDVATFFADPIYDVSHALYIDRLRQGFKDLLGRSSDDQVDTHLPSPTTTGGPTPTTLPPRQTFTAEHPLRLWIGGDSLSEVPGQELIDQAVATGAVGVVGPVDFHISTGLARPEVFNWPAYLKEVLPPDRPNAVVLTFGANDDQTLTGDNGGESFGTPEWVAEYGRRVGGLFDEITSLPSHPRVFMVGIPPVRDTARFDDHYKLINSIFAAQAKLRPGRVYYVDTVSALGTPSGGYTDYLPQLDGTVVQIRSDDGIHVTDAGGARVATKIISVMREAFNLEGTVTSSGPTKPTTGHHATAATTTTTAAKTTAAAPR